MYAGGFPQPLDETLNEIRQDIPKGMVFSKDSINLSKVVGQGECFMMCTIAHSVGNGF